MYRPYIPKKKVLEKLKIQYALQSLQSSAVMMYTKNSNTAAIKISFRSKTIRKHMKNEKLFLAAVFEFVYVITALIFSHKCFLHFGPLPSNYVVYGQPHALYDDHIPKYRLGRSCTTKIFSWCLGSGRSGLCNKLSQAPNIKDISISFVSKLWQ